MKIILVTGGAGFIGSHFIKHFLRRNKNFILINLDKQAYSADEGRLEELVNSPRYHHIKGDVCNRDLIDYVLRKYRPAWIVNCCSEPYSSRDPKKFQAVDETSYSSTLALLEGARFLWMNTSANDKRFLQISTDEVYGIPEDETDYCEENTRLSPESPYSAIKAGADLMVKAYCRSYGLPAVILRGCCTYGPWQSSQYLIPSIMESILSDKTIELRSEGSVKEWLHVSDMSSAITRALFFARPGEVYNIGSGETANSAEIASRLLKLAGKQQDRLVVNGRAARREGCRRLNSYKANCNLKWSTSYTLDEGLLNTLEWYKNNRSFQKQPL